MNLNSIAPEGCSLTLVISVLRLDRTSRQTRSPKYYRDSALIHPDEQSSEATRLFREAKSRMTKKRVSAVVCVEAVKLFDTH